MYIIVDYEGCCSAYGVDVYRAENDVVDSFFASDIVTFVEESVEDKGGCSQCVPTVSVSDTSYANGEVDYRIELAPKSDGPLLDLVIVENK